MFACANVKKSFAVENRTLFALTPNFRPIKSQRALTKKLQPTHSNAKRLNKKKRAYRVKRYTRFFLLIQKFWEKGVVWRGRRTFLKVLLPLHDYTIPYLP